MMSPEHRPFPPPLESEDSWRERSSGMASVSVFLSDPSGRLLMVQDLNRYGGKWSPIAGYIDDLLGEEPEIAALREAKEEMGLDVRLDTLLGVWHYYENGTNREKSNPPKIHVGYAYTGTILGGSFTKQDAEIQDWGFFTPAEIEAMFQHGQLKTPEYNYQGFRLWQQGKKHPLDVILSNRTVTQNA